MAVYNDDSIRVQWCLMLKEKTKSAVNENAARGIDLEQQNVERGKR